MPTISKANPPKARKKLVKTKVHDTELSDQFGWIRDDTWQEVLHSPNVLKKNIRQTKVNLLAWNIRWIMSQIPLNIYIYGI